MAEQSTSDNASSSPKAGGTGGLNGQGKRPHSPDNQERAPRQSQPNRADELDGQGHVKIQPQVHVVRRACNECRQQKVGHIYFASLCSCSVLYYLLPFDMKCISVRPLRAKVPANFVLWCSATMRCCTRPIHVLLTL